MKPLVIVMTIAALLMASLTGCSDDSDRNPPGPTNGPTIASISPASDTVGAILTITGSRFSPVIEENIVKIGSIEASVATAEPTQLTIEVPRGAIAGKVAVTVDGVTGTSSADFVVKMIPVPAPAVAYCDVCWTGSLFVAVGGSGKIAISPNGQTWSSATSPTTSTLWGVVGNDTGIVAVGNNARVLFSSNGIDWSSRPNDATGALVSVCASANCFVAIPASGSYVITSRDGLTWERKELDTALTMSHVGWHGRFLALADRLWTISSLDGLQWQRGITNLTEPPVRGSAWSGTRSIITKEWSLHYLSGGNMWSDCDPSSSLMSSFSDIAWTGDYFLVVGDSSAIWSPDGWNWKAHTQISASSTGPLKVACSPEACVVVGGFGGTIYRWQQP
jgi:hypothetical protein